MNQRKHRGLYHILSAGAVLLMLLPGCSREPQKTPAPPAAGGSGNAAEAPVQSTPSPEAGKPASSAQQEIPAESRILATIDKAEKLSETPDPSSAYSNPHAGHGTMPDYSVVFSAQGRGAAYIAEKGGKAYVVHNGKAGKAYQSIGPVVLSPDGQRFAYVAHVKGKWLVIADGKEGEVFDLVGEPVFSPDSRHLAYEAQAGEKWHLILDSRRSPKSQGFYDKPVFSADSSKIFYIEHTEDDLKKRFIVSDLVFKKQHIREYKPGQVLTNKSLTKVAAVVALGEKKRIMEFSFSNPGALKEGPEYDDISYLAFGPDDKALLYAVEKNGVRSLILNGREEQLPEGSHPAGMPVILPGNRGAGMILASDSGVSLHQAFQKGPKEKKYEEANSLTYNRDGSLHAYAAKKGEKWFIVINGKEGPAFDRVVSPVFSPDGSKLVYRVRQDGRRFVVTADTAGRILKKHPAYEQVFQPVFVNEGNSVAYGVKDGQKLEWKVERIDK